MYVDFAYYSTIWKGQLTEAEFDAQINQAHQQVDYVTFERLTTIPAEQLSDKVKKCVCELIDHKNKVSKTLTEEGGKVKGVLISESVDKYRRGFEVPKQLSLDKSDEQDLIICQRWLTRPINFMYNGEGWYM